MDMIWSAYEFISGLIHNSIGINANFTAGSGGINVASIGNIATGIYMGLLFIAAMYAVLVSLKETEGGGFGVVISMFLRGGLIITVGAVILAFVAA